MGIPHKALYCKRIIFSLFTIFGMLAMLSHHANAQSTLYVVKNITVDVTAENSVSAQEKAFEQAQKKAYDQLVDRLVEEGQVEGIKTADNDTISTFIRDFEVTNERLSATRYIGTYTFRFRETAIAQYFSNSGVTFTQAQSRPLLVLPVIQIRGKNMLWSEENVWMQAWSRIQVSPGVVPVEVPIGDLSDINDIDNNQPLRYERSKLNRMLSRYNASEAAIMIAVPDQNLALSRTSADKAIGTLRLSIYRTDRAQAEHVNDIILEGQPEESVGQLYDRAVLAGHKALQSDWKRKTGASSAERNNYTVNVPLRSLREWVKIYNALNSTPGLDSITINSMRKSLANVYFAFRGNEDKLRRALIRSGLEISQPYANGNNAEQILYDLKIAEFRSPSGFIDRETQPVKPKAAGEKRDNAGPFHNIIGNGNTATVHTF